MTDLCPPRQAAIDPLQSVKLPMQSGDNPCISGVIDHRGLHTVSNNLTLAECMCIQPSIDLLCF